MGTIDRLKQLAEDVRVSASVFARDVGRGMLEISHNSLAAVGLLVVAVGLFFSSHGELRHDIEVRVYDWLQSRHVARSESDGDLLADVREPDAVARATAASLTTLSRQQAAVAQWISRRYRVAPEPIARLVQEAWTIGQKAKLEPTLILAIMAIESSFNPFAQSSVGAQGLMQVMTRVHDDKYEPFGGIHAAFDPVTNLRVGVQVLKECIARAGGLEEGLRYYVGAANLPDDQGYAGRVLTEHAYLKSVAEGRSVPVSAPVYRPAPAAPLVAPPTGVPVAASAPTPARTVTPTLADEHTVDGRVALLAK